MKTAINLIINVLVSFSAVSVAGATSPPIVGAWQLGDGKANDSLVYVFLGNGIYFLAVDTNTAAFPSEFDGMERGTYTWNETTGKLLTTPTVSTNGSIVDAPPFDSVTIDGDVMTATDSEGSFDFKRV
jgi:hypothetical protein